MLFTSTFSQEWKWEEVPAPSHHSLNYVSGIEMYLLSVGLGLLVPALQFTELELEDAAVLGGGLQLLLELTELSRFVVPKLIMHLLHLQVQV